MSEVYQKKQEIRGRNEKLREFRNFIKKILAELVKNTLPESISDKRKLASLRIRLQTKFEKINTVSGYDKWSTTNPAV